MIFIIGDLGDLEARILITTLAIGGSSLTGLCSASLYEKGEYRLFGIFGMCMSAFTLLVSITVTWDGLPFDEFWKFAIALIIVCVALAHMSLLFMIQPKNKEIAYVRNTTIVIIGVVASMFVISTFSEFSEGETYFRFLGVLSILDVLGTILTPFLNKVSAEKI